MATQTPQAIRGTQDIFGAEAEAFARVVETFERLRRLYRFRRVEMPVFEKTAVFSRSLGETTDVVSKEMYSFDDRGGESLTLRPEFTAGIARAYLTDGWQQYAPVKIATHGPLFRYERPQKGRYRQFHQIDAEVIGAAEPQADVELLVMADHLLKELGIADGVTLQLNTLGDGASREAWRTALVDYFRAHRAELSEDSQDRLERNPLRILDCKKPECKALTEKAPAMIDSLCDECRVHFDGVMAGLSRIGAVVKIDNRLVRGLDYYTKTAFEVLAGELGSQNAVCGGGRYDNLAESIGGPHVPGVGFAAGIERIILTLEGQGVSLGEEPRTGIFVVAASPAAGLEVAAIVHELRAAGLSADMDFADRSLKAQMKHASSTGAGFACIVGEDELASGSVAVKNMQNGEQISVPRGEIAKKLLIRREG